MSYVFGVNGDPKTGKTLWLTVMALMYAKAGYRVFSNYWIGHKNVKLIGIYELAQMLALAWKNPSNSPIFKAVLCGSELYAWIESRRSGSHENVLFSYYLFQAGKLGITTLYDAQINDTCDNRLRRLCRVRWEAEPHLDKGYFQYHVLDRKFPDDNVRTGRSFKLPVAFARKIYPLYRAYEGVEPLGFDGLLSEMAVNDKVAMKGIVARQVALLAKKRDIYGFGRKADRARVAYALMCEGESDAFADKVAVGLSLMS